MSKRRSSILVSDPGEKLNCWSCSKRKANAEPQMESPPLRDEALIPRHFPCNIFYLTAEHLDSSSVNTLGHTRVFLSLCNTTSVTDAIIFVPEIFQLPWFLKFLRTWIAQVQPPSGIHVNLEYYLQSLIQLSRDLVE